MLDVLLCMYKYVNKRVNMCMYVHMHVHILHAGMYVYIIFLNTYIYMYMYIYIYHIHAPHRTTHQKYPSNSSLSSKGQRQLWSELFPTQFFQLVIAKDG